MVYKNVWIRIAGYSKRIKEDSPEPRWRFEVEGQEEQRPLKEWILVGEATQTNNTQGTNSNAQGSEFLAWVRYYGDMEVGNDCKAIITLKNP